MHENGAKGGALPQDCPGLRPVPAAYQLGDKVPNCSAPPLPICKIGLTGVSSPRAAERVRRETCGKCLEEGSWRTPKTPAGASRQAPGHCVASFTGDGSEAQRGKKPAEVTQLDSRRPRSRSPRADPEVRVCLILAVPKGDWVGVGRAGQGRQGSRVRCSFRPGSALGGSL